MSTVLEAGRKRPYIRLRSSTKIAIGVVLLAAFVYIAWNWVVGAWIMSQRFPGILPGKVSLIGIKADKGCRIQVANRMAQLVIGEGVGFDPAAQTTNSTDTDEGGDTEGGSKKRIPIKEMLGALGGDIPLLNSFVSILNGLQPDEKDWPVYRVVWKSEDIQKALAGDKALERKLSRDLNVGLDGTPLDTLEIKSLENGIIVDSPVPVHVQVGPDNKILTARIQRPYRPQFCAIVNAAYEKNPNLSNTIRLGTYAQYADYFKDQNLPRTGKTPSEEDVKKEARAPKEDVRAVLDGLVSDRSVREYAQLAEKVLGSAQVIVSDRYIESAAYDRSEMSGKEFYNLNINVNEEGRRRLWQYSRAHPHDQLLLISDGVAIAAPRIRHELVSKQLTIVQMPDESLVQDAVAAINEVHKKS